ncbi:MAG: nucleotide pyrophosphohydrolase [Armatimonadetes bacterium]|nr:nucleotide pyrophosphohydrolase [Armatimonadota bacterium]
MITVVGLGPAGIDAMSASALAVLESAQRPLIRTARHPAAQELAARGMSFETFDEVYDTASDFEEVYGSIASRIIEEARESEVTYAVPGHPLIAERSVALIIERAKSEGIPVRIAASKSFIEACLEALIIPIDKGLKLVDGLEIKRMSVSCDCPILIYQVYDRLVASEVKLVLMEVYPDDFEVYVISDAGGPNMLIDKRPLYTLDRRDYDHLTSIYVPERRAMSDER